MGVLAAIARVIVGRNDNRKWACHHGHLKFDGDKPDYVEVVGSEVVGATMGWGVSLERQFRFEYRCNKCGEKYFKGGYTVYGDKERNPEMFDDEGYPLDKEGSRLPILFGLNTKR